MDTPNRLDTKGAGPKISRRTLLGTTGGVSLSVAMGAGAAGSEAFEKRSRESAGFATFEWLGTAGWRIATPKSTILLDPYLSRFDTGLARGKFNATTPLTLDPVAIDRALGGPNGGHDSVDAILVTHTHWDHFADVPHIAKTRGGTVYTTLSGYHLGRAMGLPAAQLAVVKGGEELNIGDAVIRVVGSLHSRSGNGGVLFPGVRTQVPEPPSTIADLPEGDTLSFLIRRPQGGSGVLLLGASDYDDQALRGLDVDTVALPVPSNAITADYVGRLLRVLNLPRTVVLVHWDNFESPLRNPPPTDDQTRVRLHALTAEIKRVSPRTRVLEPMYATPMSLL